LCLSACGAKGTYEACLEFASAAAAIPVEQITVIALLISRPHAVTTFGSTHRSGAGDSA
jgi:hypothetical protein